MRLSITKTESKQLIAYESHVTEPGRSETEAGRSAQVRGVHLIASLADALLARNPIFPLVGEGRLRDELKQRLQQFGSPRPTNLKFSWLVRHERSNPNTNQQIRMAFSYFERKKCGLTEDEFKLHFCENIMIERYISLKNIERKKISFRQPKSSIFFPSFSELVPRAFPLNLRE